MIDRDLFRRAHFSAGVLTDPEMRRAYYDER
jgi:hypothetical protein